jgi:hypothetical protein
VVLLLASLPNCQPLEIQKVIEHNFFPLQNSPKIEKKKQKLIKPIFLKDFFVSTLMLRFPPQIRQQNPKRNSLSDKQRKQRGFLHKTLWRI